jgi:hypothetical protein
MQRTRLVALAAGIALASSVTPVLAQHEHSMSGEGMQMTPVQDARQLVVFPEALREHELANMRDHLATLARIQAYLAKHEFEKAGNLAEQRLGMSSFGLHGAHEVAPYMPKGMQEAGTAMHHAASRFAIATQEAAIDDDVGRALGALNQVTQACVACHAAYRLR